MNNNGEKDLLGNIGEHQQNKLDIPKTPNNGSYRNGKYNTNNNNYQYNNKSNGSKTKKESNYANVRFEIKDVLYEMSDRYLFRINETKKIGVYKNVCRLSKERDFFGVGINFLPDKNHNLFSILGDNEKDKPIFYKSRDLYDLLKNSNKLIEKDPFPNDSFELDLQEI